MGELKRKRKDAKHTTCGGRLIIRYNGLEPRSASHHWELYKEFRDDNLEDLESLIHQLNKEKEYCKSEQELRDIRTDILILSDLKDKERVRELDERLDNEYEQLEHDENGTTTYTRGGSGYINESAYYEEDENGDYVYGTFSGDGDEVLQKNTIYYNEDEEEEEKVKKPYRKSNREVYDGWSYELDL